VYGCAAGAEVSQEHNPPTQSNLIVDALLYPVFLILHLLARAVVYAWAVAIIACFAFALWNGYRALSQRDTAHALVSILAVLVLATITEPLWFSGVSLEIQCRKSGLMREDAVVAAEQGLFWKSNSDSSRDEVTTSAIRAVAEGRIAYLEIPYSSAGGSKNKVTQKLYVAPKAVARSQCLDDGLGSAYGKLPPTHCVAWEIAEDLETRYELVQEQSKGQFGGTINVVDRIADRTIASYTHTSKTRAPDTLLALIGISSLQPASCEPRMTNVEPSTMMPALVFQAPDGSRVDIEKLAEYAKIPWKLVADATNQLVVPDGKDGIDYWVKQGKIRLLTDADDKLWRSANRFRWFPTSVPHNTYLILAPITLPASLHGGQGVKWVVGEGQPMPRGPRGGTIYRVGDGCVWLCISDD
jgi:hypothetical protein